MKVKYTIEGLDCAVCAGEVEEHLNKDKNISKASVDFASGTLFVNYVGDSYRLEDLQKKVREVEGEVKLHAERTDIKKSPILTRRSLWLLVRILLASAFLFTAYFADFNVPWLTLVLYAFAYAAVAYDVFWQALKNVFRLKDVFDEKLLMSVATLGAFAIGEYPEAVLVMLLYQLGEIFEEIAVNRSRNAILSAIDMRSNIASLVKDGKTETVAPNQLAIGDLILVRSGEAIPTDGVVENGESAVDMSSLTGEPLPIFATQGTSVLSGGVVKNGALYIRVKTLYKDSTVSKILDLMTQQSENKAKAEKFISRFAKVYTPIVFALALILAIVPPIFTGEWLTYLYRALIFLVVSCPCAIVISVPLAFFAGLGLASKHGIIIKGSTYLDRINDIRSVLFDKTGTMTQGTFVVSKYQPAGMPTDDFLRMVVSMESLSSHPLAKAVVHSFDITPDTTQISDFKEIPGMGIKATYQGHSVLMGNETLLYEENVFFTPATDFGSIIHVAVDGGYRGFIVLTDEIKQNSRNLISELRRRGISTVMLTGDFKENAQYVAFQLNVDQTYYQLLPQDKVTQIELEMAKRPGVVAFVGDGVNDAPSLMRADVGIAMGGIGSDLAVNNSDVVIMNDDPIKVVDAIDIAHKVRRRASSNIFIALLVKSAVLALAVFGIAHMWIAVLADVGLSLLLVLNSLRLLWKKI